MRGFKEHHLQSVCNDLLDFTGVLVSPSQLYNHLRKWRAKWKMVCKLKNLPEVSFHSASCAIMMDKEQLKIHLMVIFAYHFFVEHVQTVMLN
jgi:pyridoxal biosynthesis lyase PdxS